MNTLLETHFPVKNLPQLSCSSTNACGRIRYSDHICECTDKHWLGKIHWKCSLCSPNEIFLTWQTCLHEYLKNFVFFFFNWIKKILKLRISALNTKRNIFLCVFIFQFDLRIVWKSYAAWHNDMLSTPISVWLNTHVFC